MFNKRVKREKKNTWLSITFSSETFHVDWHQIVIRAPCIVFLCFDVWSECATCFCIYIALLCLAVSWGFVSCFSILLCCVCRVHVVKLTKAFSPFASVFVYLHVFLSSSALSSPWHHLFHLRVWSNYKQSSRNNNKSGGVKFCVKLYSTQQESGACACISFLCILGALQIEESAEGYSIFVCHEQSIYNQYHYVQL